MHKIDIRKTSCPRPFFQESGDDCVDNTYMLNEVIGKSKNRLPCVWW